MKTQIILILSILTLSQFFIFDSFAQSAGSPFEREFSDVKFLDAYFGTIDEKIEIEPGDQNIPFTIIFANIGTQDITGVIGQLQLSLGFSSSDGPGSLIFADNDGNALAGENFALTFFVNIDNSVEIMQHPGTVKVDYSRLRESGIRNGFFDFNFKVTGDSILNMRPTDRVLNSLTINDVVVEVVNDGTAPLSSVDIVLQNTASTISSTSQSITNVEKVVFTESHWDLGNIEPKSTKYLSFDIYIPQSIKDAPLHVPMDITYFDAHGTQHTISRSVDFFIRGLIDVTIYDVEAKQLGDRHLVIGEILNEGNEDGMFGFVSLEPLGDSNIKPQTQYIDEIETESPVPFNILLEFDGEEKEGEHEIRITVRYKDSVREEHFVTYDTTIFYEQSKESGPQFDLMQYIIPIIAIIGGIVGFAVYKKRKHKAQEIVQS